MKALTNRTPRHTATRRLSTLLLSGLSLSLLQACATNATPPHADHDTPPSHNLPFPIDPRAAPSALAICYGPYREGQAPGADQPTRPQLLEDLGIIARHFNTLRTYSTRGPTAPAILDLIETHQLPLQVFLGVWIDTEARRDESGNIIETLPEAAAANRLDVERAIRLARAHPDTVAAVIVGNETQIFWTAHPVDTDTLITHVRAVRDAVDAPVTTADDFRYWLEPDSRRLADELDFIITHAYAMWNGMQLDEAIDFTDEQVAAVRAAHPDHLVILGETGWATQKHTEGDQAKYIKGQPGQTQQSIFLQRLQRWARDTGTIVFFFEAFDEPWKGGPHPDEVEKHWGLYNVDRTPKPAARHLNPDPAPTR